MQPAPLPPRSAGTGRDRRCAVARSADRARAIDRSRRAPRSTPRTSRPLPPAAQRLQATRAAGSPLVPLTAIILRAGRANVVLIGWRSDVVRLLPQTASLYAAIGLPVNLRGLASTTSRISRGSMTACRCWWSKATSSHRRPAGRGAAAAVRGAQRAGQEIYAWTALPGRSVLGRARRCRSAPASPRRRRCARCDGAFLQPARHGRGSPLSRCRAS